MRLRRDAERDLIVKARSYPTDHVVFPAGVYARDDGALTVHRDGVQELLHRRLFRIIREPALGRRKLIRTCDRWGCVQPYHYMIVSGLRRGSKRRCANGHLYAEVGVTTTGHCAVCAPMRAAVRAGAGESVATRNAAKNFCPRGHEYTPENTYLAPTGSGARRKCRRCAADRAARRRNALC